MGRGEEVRGRRGEEDKEEGERRRKGEEESQVRVSTELKVTYQCFPQI